MRLSILSTSGVPAAAAHATGQALPALGRDDAAKPNRLPRWRYSGQTGGAHGRFAVSAVRGGRVLVEEQIQERQKRAKDAIQSIRTSPATQPFGDYEVLSTSGKEYRVAMRGPGLFENYCTCPDFARNTLGTCKHIESILGRLRARHKSKLSRRKYERERASVSLLYGETLDVQLKLPDRSDPALQQIAAKHFDTAGLLRRDQYAFFANIMEGIRKADASAVVLQRRRRVRR